MCANDGRTYNTECEMKLAGCKRGMNITKLHDGECRKSKRIHFLKEFIEQSLIISSIKQIVRPVIPWKYFILNYITSI